MAFHLGVKCLMSSIPYLNNVKNTKSKKQKKKKNTYISISDQKTHFPLSMLSTFSFFFPFNSLVCYCENSTKSLPFINIKIMYSIPAYLYLSSFSCSQSPVSSQTISFCGAINTNRMLSNTLQYM